MTDLKISANDVNSVCSTDTTSSTTSSMAVGKKETNSCTCHYFLQDISLERLSHQCRSHLGSVELDDTIHTASLVLTEAYFVYSHTIIIGSDRGDLTLSIITLHYLLSDR